MARRKNKPTDPDALGAVAEAWASIDGKLDAYRAEAPGSHDPGHRDGYNIDALELIVRTERRGFTLMRVAPRGWEWTLAPKSERWPA